MKVSHHPNRFGLQSYNSPISFTLIPCVLSSDDGAKMFYKMIKKPLK